MPLSQLMSYGKQSGDSYVSSITLAFMEDTGHYLVQPGTGGSLVTDLISATSCAGSGSTATLDFVFGNYQAAEVRWCCAA